MVSVFSLRGDAAKKTTATNREELVSTAQHATQSRFLSLTPMPFITRLAVGWSLMKIHWEEKPPWLRDEPGIETSLYLTQKMGIGAQGVMEDERGDEDAPKQKTATELMMMMAMSEFEYCQPGIPERTYSHPP